MDELEFLKVRRQLVGAWTGAKDAGLAITMRIAAREEFRLSCIATARRPRYMARRAEIERLKPVLRRIYYETQQSLDHVQMVRLYRGVPENVLLIPLCIASYTSDLTTARRFGSIILTEDIPTSRILWWHGAPGWIDGPYGLQHEYLVLSEEPN